MDEKIMNSFRTQICPAWIGNGKTVQKLLCKPNSFTVVSKVYAKEGCFVTKTYTRNKVPNHHLLFIHNELHIIKVLERHPNIIEFYGYDITDETITIYMEYANDGDAFDFLHSQHGNLPFLLICQIVHETSSALAHLHSRCIVHADVKPENVFVFSDNSRYTFKLADFGKCIILQPGHIFPRIKTGTSQYLSPEIICQFFTNNSSEATYDERIDVWSLGILCYELFYKKTPFMNKKEILTKEITFDNSIPLRMKELISRCLTKKNTERPHMRDVLDWIEERQE